MPIDQSNPDQAGCGKPQEVSHLVEHLFRHESAKTVASLTRIFGVEHLTLAEDVVQETLARALQTWPFYGVPLNPAAWIMRASRNLALDFVRREKRFRDKEPEIIATLEQWPSGNMRDDQPMLEHEIEDDRLRMMFVCCHPLISQEDQVALALKTLCGFSAVEIARAFLNSEAAIAKRLTRAKQKIYAAPVRFEIPEGEELLRRLDGVLQTLYLMFNEGYKASGGDRLVREDVCREAIRLTSLLVRHPAGNLPKSHALLALMLLNAARLPARMGDNGNMLRLQEQDRSRWDAALIAQGMFHFAQSAQGGDLSPYHLQSGIAACHSAAKNYAATNWIRILELYDLLAQTDNSPVVALNRAVVLAEVHGPQAGIRAVKSMANLQALDAYYLLHAVLGEFEMRLRRPRAAAAHFEKALSLTEITSEQRFLAGRLQACGATPV